MLSENTQLTYAENFDINKLLFTKQNDESAGKSGSIRYKRIRYLYENNDGTQADVAVEPGKLFSFGVRPSFDQNSGELTGYNIGLSLYDIKEGPTERQSMFIDLNEKIADKTAIHLFENKGEIKKPKLTMSDLRDLSRISWQCDEKGEPLPDKAPSLFPKLIFSKRYNKIYSKFFEIKTEYDESGREKKVLKSIEPLDLVDKRFYITPVIRFESIYIGAKISIQVKLYEGLVEFPQTEHKSLLSGLLLSRQEEERTENEHVSPPPDSGVEN